MDLTKLSDEDLMALKAGDLSRVSDAGLMALKGVEQPPQSPKQGAVERTISNIPSSAARFGEGIYQSISHPLDTLKGVADLAAGTLRNVTPDSVRSVIDRMDPNPGAAENASAVASSVGDFYKNRYGGLENVAETIQTDPVGFAADVSALAGVGGMLAPGKAGAALGQVSKYTNPLTAASGAAKVAGKAVGAGGKQLLGLTTGVGPENISQAFKAGKAGDRAFIESMTGQRSATEVLQEARDALQTMRQTRGGNYKANIASTAADKTRLNFGDIDKAVSDTMASLKFGSQWKIGKDQLGKVQEMEKIVRNWRIDKSMHTPMGLDALKQRLDALYPDSPAHTQAQRAITSVRNAVKDTIVKQSPEYAKTMGEYEAALKMEREIERALSLGKNAAEDTAIRKLQSLSRNNVNTNYGNRLELAKTLEQQGNVSLMPAISGQAMNSWTSRGLGGQLGMGGTVTAAALMQNPLLASLLLPQSPRAVGTALYAAGRGAKAAGGTGLTADMLAKTGLLGYALDQAQAKQDW